MRKLKLYVDIFANGDDAAYRKMLNKNFGRKIIFTRDVSFKANESNFLYECVCARLHFS